MIIFFQTRRHLDEKLCEITYLADRHIISDQCANFAQLLAKKVRERKINYSREELLRTCVFLRLPYISAAQLRLGACAEGHIQSKSKDTG